MRRGLTCVLFAVLLLVGNAPQVLAQQNDAEKAAEFVHLWEHLAQTRDLEERIRLAEQALRSERELQQWPLALARDEAQALLWSWLADAYDEWPRGERADNLEKAIAAYEQALQILTRERAVMAWASLQTNLANAYAGRIRGERADNLEKAVEAYEAALTVFTREAAPRDWALAQNNLATAYAERVRGERATNVEKAIAAFEAALSVTTREEMPQEWARGQSNLANAYIDRIRGERADNLERAIAAHEAALTVRTREALPWEWAQTQNNLAAAFVERIHGERADNLEKAIAAYEAALTVRTREALPREWAQTLSNLASVYETRIRGTRSDNLEKAITAFEDVLTVRTREALPREWSQTQNNLGNAYGSRIRAERADNLEKAIAAYEAALTVRTRETLPREWAETQHNLGIALEARMRGERAENLRKAIAAYEAALTVTTREALPREWAQTQSNLGIAYQSRTDGDHADNLAKAIAHFEAALTIRTREALPRDHLQTGQHLGKALLQAREWRQAGSAYASARDAFLLLLGQGLDDAGARDLIALAGQLFAEAAYAAVQRGENDAALTLASEGRARLMAVALKLQSLNLPADKRLRLDELRAAIRTEQHWVEATQGVERAAAIEKLTGLREELLRLVKAATAAESAPATVLTQARAIVAKGGAIVMPVLTAAGAKILIVAHSTGGDRVAQSSSLTVLDLPELTTGRLDKLMRGEGGTGGWLGAYNINYLQGDAQNQRWSEWLAAVDGLGLQLWPLLGGPLDAALKKLGIKSGSRLIWMPAGELGILPIGLVQEPASRRRLADDYGIVYAPSLDALAVAQKQIAKLTSATLAAVINPTEDLAGSEREGELVASHFPANARTVLERSAATPDAVLGALKGKTHWHFASHGTFSWRDARQSALVMHGNALLSVGRLLETDGLGRPRLVVLSACETGLYDIDNTPDEFIGLPGAFMGLGAAGVVGTLWPVSDAATALLIAKFYELHMGERLPPPTALSRAQRWLRQATNVGLQDYARIAASQGRLSPGHMTKIEAELSPEALTHFRNAAAVEWIRPGAGPTGKNGQPSLARPFAHPFFWAGFIYTGL